MCCVWVREMCIAYPTLVLAPCPSHKNLTDKPSLLEFFCFTFTAEFLIPFALISGSKCWRGSTSPHQRNHAVRWEEETIQQPVWSQGANRRGDGSLQNETTETWWPHGLFSWAVVTGSFIPAHKCFFHTCLQLSRDLIPLHVSKMAEMAETFLCSKEVCESFFSADMSSLVLTRVL